jgi:hypothetical protein
MANHQQINCVNQMHQPNLIDEVLLDLLRVLAEVQLWEVASSSLLQTVAGRQLYFGLIRHLVNKDKSGLTVESMKQIYFDKGINLTERGVRLTIRSFEADGVLVLDKSETDRRSRRIFLTEKFEDQMRNHALVIKRELEKNYLMIKK